MEHTHIHIYIYMCVCVHEHMYICICVCTYMYIYIYVRIHIYWDHLFCLILSGKDYQAAMAAPLGIHGVPILRQVQLQQDQLKQLRADTWLQYCRNLKYPNVMAYQHPTMDLSFR